MKNVEIKYLFISIILEYLQVECIYDKVNFIFDNPKYEDFEDVLDKRIFDSIFDRTIDIYVLKKLIHTEVVDFENINIHIKNPSLFFNLLTRLINETNKYLNHDTTYYFAKEFLIMIWLRCGFNDFDNIEDFLKDQIIFLNDRTLGEIDQEKLIGKYNDYNVYGKNVVNKYWDETPLSYELYIKNENDIHDLSKVLYGIKCENEKKVCYIYGVQQLDNPRKNSKIQRDLYSLNKDKKILSVHPNQVCALLYFTEELLKNDIDEIRVVPIQVLNYSYHQKLSDNCTGMIKDLWSKTDISKLDEDAKKSYEFDLKCFKTFGNKADLISKNKTEKFYDLIFRLLEHNDRFYMTNDIDVMQDSLVLKRKI